MAEQQQPKTRKRWGLQALLIGLVIAAAGGKLWWSYKFPYGYSHSCSAGLGIDLRQYAEEHSGWFPYGEATPEASLSLVRTTDPAAVRWWMRGKHLPQSVVDQAIARDGVLSPETCGWHYIEGLREDDNPGTAIAWDKVTGLGHNGERRPGLAHEVVFLDCSHQYIFTQEWPGFAATQKLFLAEVIAKRSSNDPPIRWSDESTFGPNRFSPRTISKTK